jgi:hypothetical protein
MVREVIMRVKLGEFVSDEQGVDIRRVMLLRHSDYDCAKLRPRGVNLAEHTAVQGTETKYDFYKKGAEVEFVVAIESDMVGAVYRVDGIEREGTIREIGGAALREFNHQEGREDRIPGRRFLLERVASRSVGTHVIGWTGKQRIPVARSNGTLFGQIEVDLP